MHGGRLDFFLLVGTLLLEAVVIDVVLLASKGVVNREESWLTRYRLDDRLDALLELLLVKAHSWHGKRRELLGLTHRHAEVQTLELLGCSRNTDQLLLETLLLSCQEEVRGHQFRIETLVDLRIV